MIVVNLKKYVSGRQAAKIIEICNRVANDTGIRIVAATQPEDLQTGCWTQHLYLPEVPTLLNHSDYPLTPQMLNDQFNDTAVASIIFRRGQNYSVGGRHEFLQRIC